MKDTLSYLIQHKTLDRHMAKQALIDIGTGKANAHQISAFLSVYMMRNIKSEELLGFRDAMLEMCLKMDFSEYNTIDIVGTGGDGKNTFNISTISSFVVAGAGFKVAKHGNYGVSSAVGSSNVLEHMGYKFTNDQNTLKRQLETAGMCMMHAPLFHPAMKNVAPVRKELGMKTIFNMLGPLSNPSFPQNQMLGTYSLELARLYGYINQNLDKRFIIIQALDGYDEVSLTGAFKIISNNKERILQPEDIGFAKVKPEELWGGDTAEEAAAIFKAVLGNNSTKAQKNVVLANAGLAIWCMKPEMSFHDGIQMAKESLESGKAMTAFKKFIEN